MERHRHTADERSRGDEHNMGEIAVVSPPPQPQHISKGVKSASSMPLRVHSSGVAA